MLNISYTISPRLKEYLERIENLRKQILLNPISPSRELELKWEGTFNRIYYGLKLAGSPLKKNEMLQILSEISHKKMNSNQLEVIKYKKAQDYIAQNWLGSQNPVNAQAIIELHKIIGRGTLRVPKAGLQHLLDYLQARSENPIIMAAIIGIEMEKMQLFSSHNLQISLLSSLLFLYKYGYDFRGFLAYEPEWIENPNPPAGGYKDNHSRALQSVSLTLWLEYFASCLVKRIELIAQHIENPGAARTNPKDNSWKLNDRQRSILLLLDQPQANITNRQVQKRFRISQITASRDLTKLANLGFLISHGKGRSVTYTKI